METLESLGFDRMAGDRMPIDLPDPAKSKEIKAKRAAAHAKAYRKARKGERRARGSGGEKPKRPTRPKKRK